MSRITLPVVTRRVLCSLATCLLLSACVKAPEKNTRPISNITYTDSYEKIKQAADSGDAHAMWILGYLSLISNKWPMSANEGRQYIIKAAENKSPDAQTTLIGYYNQGMGGFEKDYKKSLYWAQRMSCDQIGGYSHNIYLANLYSNKDATISNEERSLVSTNLPLAYAHLRLAGLPGKPAAEELKEEMAPEQLMRAEEILLGFRNGGCPYFAHEN